MRAEADMAIVLTRLARGKSTPAEVESRLKRARSPTTIRYLLPEPFRAQLIFETSSNPQSCS